MIIDTNEVDFIRVTADEYTGKIEVVIYNEYDVAGIRLTPRQAAQVADALVNA